MIFPIVQVPDPVLYAKAKAIDLPVWVEFKTYFRVSGLETLINDMVETSKSLRTFGQRSAGLAAPQVGHSLRLFVYSPSRDVQVFLNPTYKSAPNIVAGEAQHNEDTYHEGCFSWHLGGKLEHAKRFTRILAEGVEVLNWHNPKKVCLQGFKKILLGAEAQVWQHETDHLNGIILSGTELKDEEPKPEQVPVTEASRGPRTQNVAITVGLLAASTLGYIPPEVSKKKLKYSPYDPRSRR